MVVPVRSPSAMGPMSSSGVTGTPISNSCFQRRPRLRTSATTREDSALTTEMPTPCRPPETL